jgi:hypothetical protein
MKSTMILLSCFLFAAAIAFGQPKQSDQAGDQQNQTTTSDQSTGSSNEQTPSTDAPKLTANKAGKAVASFKGTGSQTTKAFSLEAGKATFEIMLAWEKFDANLSKEEGNFSVSLLDEAGKNPDLIIGTIDHFDGARTVDIAKAGKYMLKITAPGKWTVDVKQ